MLPQALFTPSTKAAGRERAGARSGGLRRGGAFPLPRKKKPVSRAERMWMSHRYTPARGLPKTPPPRTLMRNTGLELLQKPSSRSASSTVRRPFLWSSAAVRAPMG